MQLAESMYVFSKLSLSLKGEKSQISNRSPSVSLPITNEQHYCHKFNELRILQFGKKNHNGNSRNSRRNRFVCGTEPRSSSLSFRVDLSVILISLLE